MKSITIHNIDNDLDRKISEKAIEYGLSLNKTIKSILQDSLFFDKVKRKRESYSEFVGLWDSDEKNQFNEQIQDFNAIDTSDWK